MRKFGKFCTILGLFLLFYSCQKDASILLEPNSDIELFPNAKIIESADFINHVIVVDSLNFVLSANQNFIETYGLKKGDFLVSDVGYGMLRRVDSIITQNDKALIITSQGSLDDVIKQGYILHRQTLTSSMIDRVEYYFPGARISTDQFESTKGDTISFDFDLDLGNSIYLSGVFSMISDVIFEIEIGSWMRLKKVHYGFENTIESFVELSAGGAFTYSSKVRVAKFWFTPIIIPTVIPIVIAPVMEIHIGLDGSVEASMVTSVSQKFNFEAGILYERQSGWNAYKNSNNTWEFQPPIVTLNANAKAYAEPELAMLVYGVLGAYLNANLYSEIQVSPLTTPWWELYGGFNVGLGAKATILGFQLFDKDYPEFLTNHWKIADSGSGPPPSQTGLVSGVVKDAVSSNYLSNVQVKAFLGNNLVGGALTGANGHYEVSLPVGNGYRIEFVKSGYLTAVYHNVTVSQNVTTFLEAILQIDQIYGGNGTVKGVVSNSFNGQPIEGALLQFREGINVTSGAIVNTTTSLSNGGYSINLPAGNYTAQVSKTGFVENHFSITSIGGQTTNNQNISLTPTIGDNEIRIVLEWGEDPPDLDAHLTGPIPGSSNRFHVFFDNREFNYNNNLFASLDFDVRDSFGPETVTIYHQTNGVYKYSVHDYSNLSSNSSSVLSNSNAVVKVYFGSQLVATYHVPSNTPGTLWTVFELNGSTILPINSMTFESNPGGITKNAVKNFEQFQF